MKGARCQPIGKSGLLKLYYFGEYIMVVNRARYNQAQACKFVVINMTSGRIVGVYPNRFAALRAVPAYRGDKADAGEVANNRADQAAAPPARKP